MKSKFLYIYYFVLILILALYTNMNGSPNMLIRLGYLAALVAPLFNHIAMYPAVILCGLCISKNTFAYPFMPTEMYYYVLLSIAFAGLSLSKRKGMKTPVFFILALFYISINDLLFQGSFSPVVTVVFIVIMFHFCSEGNILVSNQLLPIAFILLSLTISYWLLFCPEARMTLYNSAGDLEQLGWRDPNYIGCALGTGLVIAVKEIMQEGRKNTFYLVLLIVTIVASTFAMLSLASRGMSLAAAISVVCLLLFSKVNKWTKALTIAAVAVFIVFLYNNQYADLLLARINTTDETGGNRTTIWATKLQAFFEEGNILNYLLGCGQNGGFKLGFNGGRSTHNDYVAVLIYYGFVGLAIFLSAIAYPLRNCSRKDRPQIASLMLYLLMCSMTIEPLCMGNIAYIGFFFYIIQLARQSRLKQLNNA